jgi:hypothetical protein
MQDRRGGGAASASYCYGVWLKHLALLHASGMRDLPQTVAELGPGGSLGIGLAALLSGAQSYYGLDVVTYTDAVRNLGVLEGLVALFKQRAARPQKGWPDFDEHLDGKLFPGSILTDEVLDQALDERRIESIRAALRDGAAGDITIKYVVPWNDPATIAEGSVDVLLSHSVLEHVNDLAGTYEAMAMWVKPGGWMSHQVDLTSHASADTWNGHWAHSERMWKLVVGKRPYLINREPCSQHLGLMGKSGWNVACALKRTREDGIARPQLAPRWDHLTDEDLACSGLFVQAQRA